METKEIEGKKYVEYDEYKEIKNRKLVSYVILVLIALAIISIVSATIILVKNKNIIQADPLAYGMDIHGFVSCQCTDAGGEEWSSQDGGFINTRERVGAINYSDFKINESLFK